jgi:hypothetical protein
MRLSTALLVFLAAAAFAQTEDAVKRPASVLVVDRGLPRVNVNNASGAARSNVRWGWHDQGFLGDDFSIGAPGEHWVIDSIRTWAVPGNGSTQPGHLGDFYQDLRLYVGGADADLSPVATAQLSAGTDGTSSPSVRISDVSTGDGLMYDDFGASLRIWQVEFANLGIPVDGAAKYRFGVWGMGRAIPGTDGKTYMWFNHASNAQLSGSRHDGADGQMLLFDAGGRAKGGFSADGNGWDKSADINVQVFAHKVGATAVSMK